MDSIKSCASALVVEGVNSIGDFAQDFSSEGDARQLLHARVLANGFWRALIMWIRLTHVLKLTQQPANNSLTRGGSQGAA